jgi:hypothetical protein
MKNYPLVFSLLLLLFTSSCCSNVNTTCTSGNLIIYTTGFQEVELRSSPLSSVPPYAVRYAPDGAFDIPIDTLMICHSLVKADTFYLSFNDPVPVASGVDDSLRNGIILDFDYKIIFPSDTLTYLITNMVDAHNSQMQLQKCSDKSPPHCYRNAISCNVNGVVTITRSTFGNSNATNSLYEVPATYIYLSK